MTARLSAMLFSESRYDFQRGLWSDIWDLIKAFANPKGLGANHPKSRATVYFGVDHPHTGFQKKT
jgi:hypothetical protein